MHHSPMRSSSVNCCLPVALRRRGVFSRHASSKPQFRVSAIDQEEFAGSLGSARTKRLAGIGNNVANSATSLYPMCLASYRSCPIPFFKHGVSTIPGPTASNSGRANKRAVAAPLPDDEPVTTATFLCMPAFSMYIGVDNKAYLPLAACNAHPSKPGWSFTGILPAT